MIDNEQCVILYVPVEHCDGSEVIREKEAPRLPSGIVWHKGLEYDCDFWTFKVKRVRVSEDGLYAFVWMKKVVLCACSQERFVKELSKNGWT